MNQTLFDRNSTPKVRKDSCAPLHATERSGERGWALNRSHFLQDVRRWLRRCLVKAVKKLRKLEGFKLQDQSLVNILLFGNGLLLQYGFRTSSLDIYDCMSRKNPVVYEPIKKSERKNFEFERIFIGKSDDQIEAIKEDFCEALVELVGDPGNNIEKASNFIRKFSRVHTLNFDLFTTRVFEKLASECSGSGQSDYFRECELLSISSSHPGTYEAGIEEISHRRMPSDHGEPTPGIARAPWNDGYVNRDGRQSWTKTARPSWYYPHGALPLTYSEVGTGSGQRKYFKQGGLTMSNWEEYKSKLAAADEEILIVLHSEAKSKKAEIYSHEPLKASLDDIATMRGDLYIYGMDISKNTDRHLWEAINNNTGICNIYIAIGVFEFGARNKISKLLPDKKNVYFFDRDLTELK